MGGEPELEPDEVQQRGRGQQRRRKIPALASEVITAELKITPTIKTFNALIRCSTKGLVRESGWSLSFVSVSTSRIFRYYDV